MLNILTGNNDAHLKNLSFLVGPEGVNLAPHYDMLSTACYESRAYEKDAWPSASTLAWPILAAERFSDLSFDMLVQAGMKMGLTQKRTRDRWVGKKADILDEDKVEDEG